MRPRLPSCPSLTGHAEGREHSRSHPPPGIWCWRVLVLFPQAAPKGLPRGGPGSGRGGAALPPGGRWGGGQGTAAAETLGSESLSSKEWPPHLDTQRVSGGVGWGDGIMFLRQGEVNG